MNPRLNFLDLRTIGYSLVVGACAGALVGSSTVGAIVWLVVYVLAAVSPRNHSTCPECGTGVNPRATRCLACGEQLYP